MNELSTSWDRQAFPVQPAVSFEFFPPSSEQLQQKLWQAFERLAPLAPRFVSVTYGAGGSTRERTHETVVAIEQKLGLRPAAHLTCVGADRGEIEAIASRYWQAGIRHIVALRGDPPEGEGKFKPHPQGYACAADLVAGLKKVADFEISVAAHPEVHPDALSPEADLENLKRKQDAGAARGITQFFFDVDVFLRFRDKAVKTGVNMPLVPGILP
ncbi:MAG: methylenetetrahydrofolate reductase, partial [Gammaproteobacteria bacterium]|nr:methylenetetrahydrofolate reductase [Gammaproteobacteria bacterium]